MSDTPDTVANLHERLAESKYVCNVCHKEDALGFASSTLGAISFAYCRRCNDAHAEPYDLLVFTVAMCGGREHVADWVHPVIEGTLRVLGGTIEQFDADVRAEMESEEVPT